MTLISTRSVARAAALLARDPDARVVVVFDDGFPGVIAFTAITLDALSNGRAAIALDGSVAPHAPVIRTLLSGGTALGGARLGYKAVHEPGLRVFVFDPARNEWCDGDVRWRPDTGKIEEPDRAPTAKGDP